MTNDQDAQKARADRLHKEIEALISSQPTGKEAEEPQGDIEVAPSSELENVGETGENSTPLDYIESDPFNTETEQELPTAVELEDDSGEAEVGDTILERPYESPRDFIERRMRELRDKDSDSEE